MTWQVRDVSAIRREFVALAKQGDISFSELCRRYDISRKTGYKWRARAQQPDAGFNDRSRRPHQSPARTPDAIVTAVLALRRENPAWGGRKLAVVLQQRGVTNVPAPSTISHILRRAGLLSTPATGAGGRYTRFEHEAPNALWQMDFKGHVAMSSGRCFPLTVLDDHSRYNLVLEAQAGTKKEVVQTALQRAFERYGLPTRINVDNGQPWGSPSAHEHGVSALTIWLIRLGIAVSFSRPAHPQTNGKDERFHRTLNNEVLKRHVLRDLPHAQALFDGWRPKYNHERPHEALGMATPASRYRVSERAFPGRLPDIEYGERDDVITVKWNGEVRWRGQRFRVSSALHALPIAIRPSETKANEFDAFFCHHRLGRLDLDSGLVLKD